MNACDMICDILAPLELPIAENIYNGNDREYIVFNVFSEHPVLFADDECAEEAAESYLHYFTKDYSHCNKTKIKKLLRSNDISIIDIETLHEKDTGYTHLIFQIQITNYNDNESEE